MSGNPPRSVSALDKTERAQSDDQNEVDGETSQKKHEPSSLLPTSSDHSVGQGAFEQYHLTVVLNPASGSREAARTWLEAERLLVSVSASSLTWEVIETTGEGDAERVKEKVQAKEKEGKKQALLVLGGDGTIHDIVNGLLAPDAEGKVSKTAVDLIVVPSGTANALYYSLFPPSSPSYPPDTPLSPFYSLLSFLSSAFPPFSAPHASASLPFLSSPPRKASLPLPIALNTLPTSPPSHVLTTVLSSAALHASILYDAESLRASHPGVERFKLAAQQNADRWWSGTLRLEGAVKRYSAESKSWVEKGEHIEVEGEFSYLVSTLVDRFESTFVPAPFRSPLSPLSPASTTTEGEGSIDLVLIRPMRHIPTAAMVREGKAEEAKKAFIERVWAVSGKMYEEGKHVEMVYDEGEREDKGEEGKEVVEVYRAKAFEWEPKNPSDAKDRLVCLDGALHELVGEDAKLRTNTLGAGEHGVRVWA
ncbi:hypothetical protein JCM8547_006406 [Rhodosporidiobolus lusitaniae]